MCRTLFSADGATAVYLDFLSSDVVALASFCLHPCFLVCMWLISLFFVLFSIVLTFFFETGGFKCFLLGGLQVTPASPNPFCGIHGAMAKCPGKTFHIECNFLPSMLEEVNKVFLMNSTRGSSGNNVLVMSMEIGRRWLLVV
jgi:hypothetical protein